MPSIKRRHFLQSAGATLATIGLSQFEFLQQADRYGRALAQGSPGRKLALLVGINRYPGLNDLYGCLADVELQWNLLVYRFGFNPKDILIVADTQIPGIDSPTITTPTRENILSAFNNHLRQAKAGDVVIFHYSGHGGLVRDSPFGELRSNRGTAQFTYNRQPVDGTLIPNDSIPSTPNPTYVRDIMGRSLFLLTRSLKTENVTLILDSCHSGSGTRGSDTIRALKARTNPELDEPSPEELEYQTRLLRDNNLSPEEFEKLRGNVAKGVAIGAANYTQLATDAKFDNGNLRAGAFTYLLTRYLWQSANAQSPEVILDKLRLSTADLAASQNNTQIPEVQANPAHNAKQPIYFLPPTASWTDAIVKTVSNGEITFWLGGVSQASLEANCTGSIFSVLDAQQREVAQIAQAHRAGLIGYGTLLSGAASAVKPGALLRERIRGIEPNPTLKVALDRSLGADLAAAETALKSIEQINVVPVDQATVVIGRVTPELQGDQPKRADSSAVGQIGLFVAAGLRPIDGSFAAGTIGDRIQDLRPRLKSLLAIQILKAVTGSDVATGSRAPTVNVSVQMIPTNASAANVTVQRFKVNTEVRLKLINNDRRNLYVAVVSINSDGSLTFLHPLAVDAEDAALLKSKTTLEPPQTVTLLPPVGSFELLTIASVQPIRNSLLALQRISSDNRSARTVAGDESLDVIGGLLGDADRTSRAGAGQPRIARDVSAIDPSRITAISTIIQVVD